MLKLSDEDLEKITNEELIKRIMELQYFQINCSQEIEILHNENKQLDEENTALEKQLKHIVNEVKNISTSVITKPFISSSVQKIETEKYIIQQKGNKEEKKEEEEEEEEETKKENENNNTEINNMQNLLKPTENNKVIVIKNDIESEKEKEKENEQENKNVEREKATSEITNNRTDNVEIKETINKDIEKTKMIEIKKNEDIYSSEKFIEHNKKNITEKEIHSTKKHVSLVNSVSKNNMYNSLLEKEKVSSFLNMASSVFNNSFFKLTSGENEKEKEKSGERKNHNQKKKKKDKEHSCSRSRSHSHSHSHSRSRRKERNIDKSKRIPKNGNDVYSFLSTQNIEPPKINNYNTSEFSDIKETENLTEQQRKEPEPLEKQKEKEQKKEKVNTHGQCENDHMNWDSNNIDRKVVHENEQMEKDEVENGEIEKRHNENEEVKTNVIENKNQIDNIEENLKNVKEYFQTTTSCENGLDSLKNEANMTDKLNTNLLEDLNKDLNEDIQKDIQKDIQEDIQENLNKEKIKHNLYNIKNDIE